MLALVTDAFGGDGGIACYNRDLITALSAMPAMTDIRIVPRNGKADSVPDKVHQLAAESNRILYSLRAFWSCLKFKPQVIFCGHIFMLPLAVLLARLFHVKVWLQLHGIEAWDKPSKFIENNLRHIEMVTCVSRYTRRRFLAWADIAADRVHVLPNTVSNAFVPLLRDVARSDYDVTGNKVLLTVSRLSSLERYKGHDRILKCLSQLRKKYPDILYLIAGEGDDEDRLKDIAHQLGVQDSVRFLGRVPNTKLPALYAAADLFLMPSTGEGFGIVFLEAMATGTPALGLDCDGSVDPLLDGELGFVSNEENLADNIAKALSFERVTDLSERVHATFGQNLFRQQVWALQGKLSGNSFHSGAPTCAV
ncbi:MAG: glycosyltransferase family 4 protein [Arenimonas sp.]